MFIIVVLQWVNTTATCTRNVEKGDFHSFTNQTHPYGNFHLFIFHLRHPLTLFLPFTLTCLSSSVVPFCRNAHSTERPLYWDFLFGSCGSLAFFSFVCCSNYFKRCVFIYIYFSPPVDVRAVCAGVCVCVWRIEWRMSQVVYHLIRRTCLLVRRKTQNSHPFSDAWILDKVKQTKKNAEFIWPILESIALFDFSIRLDYLHFGMNVWTDWKFEHFPAFQQSL